MTSEAQRFLWRRPFRAPLVLGLGGVAMVAAALLVAPHASAETARPAPAGILPAQFTKQPLQWQSCGDDTPADLRCATVRAPVDYLRPDAGSLELTFSRLATSVPAKRRGVLFFNPGGPGAPGLEVQWRAERLPKSVLEQYDLIGFDPRGIGRSSPISCGLTGDEAVQSTPYRPEMFDHDVAIARAVAAKCAATPHAGYISTRNTARDMDLIRMMLGERKISYFGVSYGTYLGAAYTQMFPDRTDRVVLDSNLDPARIWRGVFDAMGDGVVDAFDRFTAWTAQRDSTYHFGRTPDTVEKTFWDLAGQVRRHPIDVGGSDYTEQSARSDMANAAISGPQDGAAFIQELQRALRGEPHDLVIPELGGGDDAFTSLFWSVLCNDSSTWPRGRQGALDDINASIRRYPLAGDFLTNVNPCAFWSLTRDEPDLKIANRVPALLVQDEWDLQTPGPMGEGMHRALRGSRLIMVKQGRAHGVYDDGNTCAVEAVNAYLTTGMLPKRDITCTATAAPSRSTGPGRSAADLLGHPLRSR
ncbi:alpha/beta hydrolase [Actinoplanes sp. NPDC049265]|uniref:alpha/beta hydrolase n=1 Tax=Actinoplanes sp. NPDC049265 TaxID=3363902 RepID=UPI0037220036